MKVYNSFIYPQLIIILQIIKDCKLICDDRNLPFLSEGTCISNCSLENFTNKTCIIDNDIIKTQWINNLIFLSENSFNYINMAVTQENDLLIIISSYPASNTRILYGITKEGIGYFNGNKIYSMEINDGKTMGRYESEMFMIKLADISNNKEYIMSVGKSVQYVEIYDLESKNIYFQEISTFFYQLYSIEQVIGAYLKLTTTDYNYYLLGLLSLQFYHSETGIPILSLIKFRINSLGTNVDKTYYKVEVYTYRSKIISCYEISTKYIICFYKDQDNRYTIGAFSPNLELKKTEPVASADDNADKFFKCAHFYDEIGVFIYYSNDNIPYAILLFKKYCMNSNSITEQYTRIEFNEYSFFYNITLNDIIKVSDKKIYFVAVSLDRTKLYIISIYNYDQNDQNKIIQRIYEINSFKYSKYIFCSTIRLSIFNNYLAFFSDGDLGKNGTVSSLIIFSYPNSTDIDNELTKYLLNNNDIKINNITLEAKNLCKIENNVFGHILTEIKILSIDKTSNEYLSLHNDTELTQGFLSINENLKLVISKSDSIYNKFTYTIKYTCQATEPDYEEYNKYPIYIEDKGTSQKEDYYFKKNTYIGRNSYYSFILNNELTDEGCNEDCELCYNDNKELCVTCLLGSNIIDGNKICNKKLITTIIETTIPETIETTITKIIDTTIPYIKNTEEIFPIFSTVIETINKEQCTAKYIIEGVCQGELTDEMGNDIYLYIKYKLINTTQTEENILIQTQNIVFQLTELDYQKNNNLNISVINLGECEKKLREEFNIPKEYDLIIFTIDIHNIENTLTYVQYEIYHPITFKQLHLDICKDLQINITIPAILDSETLLVYQDLNSQGYNLFNSNDKFYNDICTSFTTINNTDMLLIDRKTDIYNKYANLSICQENCDLVSYNDNFKRASCYCNIQSKDSEIDLNIETKFNMKGMKDIFFQYINNSNFRVLECYKVAFDLSNIFENIGRIIMTVILLIFIVLFLVFLIKGNKDISFYLNKVGKIIFINNGGNNNLKKKIKLKSKNSKKSFINNINKIKKSNINNAKKRDDNSNLSNPIKIKKFKNYRNKENIKTMIGSLSGKTIVSTLNSNTILFKKNLLNTKNNKFKGKKKVNIFNSNKNNILFCNIINNFNNKKTIKNDKEIIKRNTQLNDQELNSLKYEKALILDKRTYFQYYYSLLKRKHLILFIFVPTNDYNLQYIKIILFLLSFSLYFSINGFFFKDETLHQIYVTSGNANYIYQISSILYSSIIPSIIKLLLQLLSLTEMSILALKKQKHEREFIKKAKTIEKCFRIKFSIFFILSFLLLFFFWYFISCFCGVYKNTQKVLIIDTLISFGLSMVYPFGLYLIPGMLRITALRSNNKDRKCLYQISTLVALI